MKLLRAIWKLINREPYEIVILILLACSLYLSIRLECEKAEKERAISELTELRVEMEWRNL
jgi:hypothetical protein